MFPFEELTRRFYQWETRGRGLLQKPVEKDGFRPKESGRAVSEDPRDGFHDGDRGGPTGQSTPIVDESLGGFLRSKVEAFRTGSPARVASTWMGHRQRRYFRRSGGRT